MNAKILISVIAFQIIAFCVWAYVVLPSPMAKTMIGWGILMFFLWSPLVIMLHFMDKKREETP